MLFGTADLWIGFVGMGLGCLGFAVFAGVHALRKRVDAVPCGLVSLLAAGTAALVFFKIMDKEGVEVEEILNSALASMEEPLQKLPSAVIAPLVSFVVGALSTWLGGKAKGVVRRWRQPKPVPPLSDAAQGVVNTLASDGLWSSMGDGGWLKLEGLDLYVDSRDGEVKAGCLTGERVPFERHEWRAIRDAARAAVGRAEECAKKKTQQKLVEKKTLLATRARRDDLPAPADPAKTPAHAGVPGQIGRLNPAHIGICPNCGCARVMSSDGCCCHCRSKAK